MAKYKICPSCGHLNDPKALLCQGKGCNYDLVMIRATEKEDPELLDEHQEKCSEDVGRQCTKCGEIYPITTIQCLNCHTSLALMPIVKVKKAPVLPPEKRNCDWSVTVLDNSSISLILKEGDKVTLGRNYELATYLQSCRGNNDATFVSGRHAELYVSEGNLFIKDLNSTNGIQVNFKSIPPDENFELQENDIVSLGGKSQYQQKGAAYFTINMIKKG